MGLGDYLQYMLALVFVLALIGLIAVGVKRFGIAGTIGGRRTARIAILEAAPVDKRRRLLLIRRDNVEHLVMIGGGQDFVVETGIEHDPNNKLELGPPLHSVEPPLTSREPVLQAEPEPKRSRRSTSAREDMPQAEPKLDAPRPLPANDQQSRTEETQSGESDAGRARARQPEQPPAEMPASTRDGERKSADAASRSPQPDRAPQRNTPPPPQPAGAAERAPAAQEDFGPNNPIRIEPKLRGGQPQAGSEPNIARPEPKAQATAQPQAQRRPAERQQERAPAPKQARQERPHAQAEVSQRTRPQTPTAQAATGQRVVAAVQKVVAAGQRVAPATPAQQRQPSRQPQAAAGNDPDLLILNDPVVRPRRA